MEDFFVSSYKNKITDSNSRSIFVNAHPQKSKNKLALDFFQQMSFYEHDAVLSKLLIQKQAFKLSYKIDYNQLINSRLNNYLVNFLRKNEEYLSSYNLSPFGIGYPIFQVYDTKNRRINYMPVFIFKLQIKGDLGITSKVSLSKTSKESIYFNPSLNSFLKNYGIDLKFNNTLIESDLNEKEVDLEELLCEILRELNIDKFNSDFKNLPLTPFPSYNGKLVNKESGIINNGVFGLYSNSKEALLEDYRKLEQQSLLCHFKSEKKNNSNPFSGLLLDHSQQRVIRAMSQGNNMVIHGPPGTGKSKTITSIISHALSNEKTCLLVCEKKTAMDVIHKNLSSLGFGSFCVKITDVKKDRRHIVDEVRNSINNYKRGSFSLFQKKQKFEVNFKTESIINRKVDRLNQVVNLINQTKKNLSKTLTENNESFAELSLKFFKEPKDNFVRDWSINLKEFDFSIKELDDLKALFKDFYKNYGFLIGAKSLYYEILDFSHLKNQMIDNLDNSKVIFRKYLGEFRELESDYNSIKQKLTSFDIKYFDRENSKDSPLLNFDIKLTFFINKVFSHLFFKSSIRSKIRHSSIESQLKQIRTIIEVFINNSHNHYVYFKLFRYLESKSTTDKSLLENYLRDSNFKNLFTDWYTHKIIRKHPFDYIDFNGYEKGYYDLETDIQIINEFVIAKTLQKLDQSRLNAFLSFEKKNSDLTIEQLFAKRSTKDRVKKSLNQITNHKSGIFPSFYPIIITNPTSCANLFPMEPGYFDYVIFDESSQLKVEDTFSCLLRGKQKIVAGDLHQLPPMNYFNSKSFTESHNDRLVEPSSLLEYCINKSYKEYYLDIHYRSNHPKLIEFSNAAFYKSKLIPLPFFTDYTPIEFHQLEGKFINRVNKIEALKVVEYIRNEIIESLSVGVATFSKTQMDEILNQIAVETSKDIDFYQKINKLKENGFFVKNLENIQGEERDVMIISTTYGLNQDGKFLEFLGPINTKARGKKILNVIITRSIYKMVVFSSIPQAKINSYKGLINENGLNGKALFYAFLNYAIAVSKNNNSQVEDVLNTLRLHQREVSNDKTDLQKNLKLFSEKLNHYLNFECDRNFKLKVNHKLGGFNYDIAILENNKYIMFIDVNGKDVSGDFEDYLFDLNRARIVKSLNLKYYRLWMSNFISNRNHELQKIKKLLTQELSY